MRFLNERLEALYEVGNVVVATGSPQLAEGAEKVMRTAWGYMPGTTPGVDAIDAVAEFRAELNKVKI
jgi:hypothetical protein